MADRISDITALADRAAAEGSKTVSLKALYSALGTEQPHHLTVRADGYTLTHACAGWCDVDSAVFRAPLVSSSHAYGRVYEVWLDDDGTLRFREVQT